MASVAPRVLVVEDEPNIRELVCLHLRHEGYACDAEADGSKALERAIAERYDLMVLDVMLPGLDGLSLCRAIRNGRLNQDVPILMLTARREEADKVVGLESGADDYLTKPFGVRELVARARALLRRPRQAAGGLPAPEASSEGVVRIHGVEIDVPKRRVRIGDRDIELTDQEFRMLHLLATHAGIVFSREALLGKIWRGDTFVTVRSVDTLVKRLRRRIETDPADPKYLLTVWEWGTNSLTFSFNPAFALVTTINAEHAELAEKTSGLSDHNHRAHGVHREGRKHPVFLSCFCGGNVRVFF